MPGLTRNISAIGHYTFPWRTANELTLLSDDDDYFAPMRRAIDEARQFILLELYLIESGRCASDFIQQLLAAAQRGVRVYLLLDAFGALALSYHDRQLLQHDNIRLRFYNPLRLSGLWRNLNRDHRKLLLVDYTQAFVGGFGITDEFDPRIAGATVWRELVMQMRGPVIDDWISLFQRAWRHSEGPALELPLTGQATATGAARARVVCINGLRRQEIKRSLLARIQRSRTRVYLTTAYFIPSRRIRRALRKAVARGVDVRLLLPGPYTDHPAVRHAGRRYYSGLLKHGVRIFEYQPRFLHAKAVLCDNWSSLGSCNFDRWNLRWNLEANVECLDSDVTAGLLRFFDAGFADSTECIAAQWHSRPRWQQWLEQFWGTVEMLVNRLLERGRGH